MRIVVVSYLAAINVLAFLAFGWDKWRAKRGAGRVPESTLLALALPLGALGAWIGAKLFRHKTSKPSFLWKLRAVTVLNVVELAVAFWLAYRE